MAKKILSLLCALTLVVSMVAIVTVTASAKDDGTAFGAFYSEKDGEGKLTNANYTTDVTQAWGKSMAHDSTYGFFLITLGGSKSITATHNSTYNLGKKFAFSFEAMFQSGKKSDYIGVIEVGKLKIELAKSSTSTVEIVPTVTYNGTSVVTFTSTVKGLTIDGNGTLANERPAISAATTNGVGGTLAANNMPTRRMPVSVTYDNGALTITFTGDDGAQSFNGTITGADFTNAGVVMKTGMATADYQSAAIGNFKGTYYPTSSSTAASSTATSSADASSAATSSVATSSADASSVATSSAATSSERKVVTTDMAGLDKATCEIPEDLGWNAAGSGLINTKLTGAALGISNGTGVVDLTAKVGTYAINSYFKLNFSLFVKNNTGEKGVKEGGENWDVKVGDFVFTFSRPTLEDAKKANQGAELWKVTYKGTELAIEGTKIFPAEGVVSHEYNSEELVAAANELKKYTEDNFGRLGWLWTSGLEATPQKANFWGNKHYNVSVEYDLGKITIKGGLDVQDVEPSVATIDMTKVAGFDANAELGACPVEVRAYNSLERTNFVSIIGLFKGVYEKGTATIDDNGNGNSGNNDSGNGNSGDNGEGGSGTPAKSGDARDLALPIAILFASLSAGALVIINRKQRA